MGSLEIVEMPLQLCAKFNSANCKLLPITNHFCEVPFQLPQAFHGFLLPKLLSCFLKATFSSLLERMVLTNTFSKTEDVILITNICILCVSLANFYHWEYIVLYTLFWLK